MSPAADLIADLTELGGAGLVVTELGRDAPPTAWTPGVVQVGVWREGPMPRGALEPFDVLLAAEPEAPGPWVGFAGAKLDGALAELKAAVAAQPVAAACAAQVLRMTLEVPFAEAFALESLAYSMLLASESFQAWPVDPRRLQRGQGELRRLYLWLMLLSPRRQWARLSRTWDRGHDV